MFSTKKCLFEEHDIKLARTNIKYRCITPTF